MRSLKSISTSWISFELDIQFSAGCEHREARDCYRFEAPRRMRGLLSFRQMGEESAFIDSSDPVPTNTGDFESNQTWLDVFSLRRRIDYGDYEIEFVGRKTAVPGRYGQMGESKNLVVVDKLISIQPVNPERWITRWVERSKARKN